MNMSTLVRQQLIRTGPVRPLTVRDRARVNQMWHLRRAARATKV